MMWVLGKELMRICRRWSCLRIVLSLLKPRVLLREGYFGIYYVAYALFRYLHTYVVTLFVI
jgi:hypothetical protein